MGDFFKSVSRIRHHLLAHYSACKYSIAVPWNLKEKQFKKLNAMMM